MKKTTFSLILVSLGAQLGWAAPDDAQKATAKPPGVSTEKKQPHPKDVEAARYLKELASQIGKQTPAEAQAAIQKLATIWKDEDVADTTTDAVPGLLERYAKQDDVSVAVPAIEALGELEPWAGAPHILSVLQEKLRDGAPRQDVYAACFRALKKLADVKETTVKAIEDYLDHRLDDVIARAADAMAGYKDAPGNVRHELFATLVKQFEGVFNASRNAKTNPAQAQKWAAVSAPVMSAMNVLSGQSLKDPAEARQWLNDHKDDKYWR